VRPPEALGYVLGDGRRVSVEFARQGRQTRVREAFDAEAVNPAERQRSGWQAILDNYKKYVEGNRPR
jgi:hypothetical protein